MAARFLNDRLVTTPSFKPAGGSGREPDTQRTEPTAGPEESPAAGGDTAPQKTALDALLRAEEQRTRNEALAHDLAEAERRRDELVERLDETIADLEKETAALGEQMASLRQRREALAALRLDLDASGRDLGALRSAKQQLHHTHIELVKLSRQRDRQPLGQAMFPSLSLGQLARVGLGLTWPVILALLASAAGIIAALIWVF